MFTPRRFVPLLYALCAPWDALVLGLVGLLAPLLGLTLTRRRGVVWARLPERAPLARIWRYSTTLGHVVLLQERAEGSSVEDHELVHVVQFEAAVVSVWLAGLSALALAKLAAPLAWCVVLVLGPWWGYFGASLAAGLRGGAPYLDNSFERHARAEVALQASSENGVKFVSRS